MRPFTWWKKSTLAPGVTRMERRDNFTAYVLTDTPGLHIHYLTSDADLAQRGWGLAHLVCHECQRARAVFYPDFDDADVPDDGLGLPAMRAERERFVAEHASHGGIYAMGGGRMLCPPNYEVVDEVDLRPA